MKVFFRRVFKSLAYTTYFLGAFVFFVYLTLPMEEAKAYLVRLASDTYNADLEITELSVDGLSGVTAEGVMLRQRPTPELLAKIKEAREARKLWREEQKNKKAKRSTVAGKPEKDSKKKDAKASKTKKDKKAAKSKKKKAKTKKKGKTVIDKGPQIPKGPVPVNITRFSAKIDPLELLSDALDGKVFNERAEVKVEAEMLGGNLNVVVERGERDVQIQGEAGKLDIRQINALFSFMSLPFSGSFGSKIDLKIPYSKKGKLQLGSIEGKLSLKMRSSVLGPGQIESKKLKSLGGIIDIPRLRLAALGGDINFAKKKARFDKFEIKGKDVSGELFGYIRLNNKPKKWRPNLYLKFKFSSAFLKRESAVKTLMKSVSYVKRGTSKDGYTGFTVTGLIDKPTFRPRKRNPHARKRAARKSPRKSAKKKKRRLRSRSKPGSKGFRKTKPSKRLGVKKGRRNASKKLKKKAPKRPKTRSRFDPAPLATPPPRPRRTPPIPSKTEVAVDDDEDDEDEDDAASGTPRKPVTKRPAKKSGDDEDTDDDGEDDDKDSDESAKDKDKDDDDETSD